MKNGNRKGLTFVEIIIVMAILAVVMVIIYMLVISATRSAQTQTTQQDLDSQCRQVMESVLKDLRETDSLTVAAGEFQQVGNHVVATRITFPKIVTMDPFTAPGTFTRVYDAAGSVTYGAVLVERPSQSAGTFELAPNGLDEDRDGLIDQCAINRNVGTQPVLQLTQRGTFPAGPGSPPVTSVWPNPATTNDEVPRYPANVSPPAIYFSWVDPDGPAGATEPQRLINVVVTLQGVDATGKRMVRSLTSKVSLRNEN